MKHSWGFKGCSPQFSSFADQCQQNGLQWWKNDKQVYISHDLQVAEKKHKAWKLVSLSTAIVSSLN